MEEQKANVVQKIWVRVPGSSPGFESRVRVPASGPSLRVTPSLSFSHPVSCHVFKCTVNKAKGQKQYTVQANHWVIVLALALASALCCSSCLNEVTFGFILQADKAPVCRGQRSNSLSRCLTGFNKHLEYLCFCHKCFIFSVFNFCLFFSVEVTNELLIKLTSVFHYCYLYQ